MADKSKIEWTDATWNPVRGCSVVSEGCRNCYAMQVAARFSGEGLPYEGLAYRNSSGAHWTGQVRLIEKHLADPLRWQRPRRIFVNSMSDLFHPEVSDAWIDRIFSVMALAPRHTFQVLTKRPARMLAYMQKLASSIVPLEGAARALGYSFKFQNISLLQWPIPNVWLGVSVEDQKTADERIPLLMQTPAAVRWLSAEPLLGLIDLEAVPTLEGSIDWVVVGGESGPGARPMHPEWARSLRDQCTAAGVPFFFKQWGEWGLNWFNDPKNKGEKVAGSEWSDRMGKKAAGRTLDGRTWSEYPEV